MIVLQSPHEGQIQLPRMLRYVGWPLLTLIGWDFVVVVCFKVLGWTWVGSQHVPLALYGSAIGIVVGFRNNSAYARWWEARTIWGQINNNSRSLARQVMTTLRPRNAADVAESNALAAMQRYLVYHQIAYAHALRQQLRGLSPWDELAPLIPAVELAELERERNLPLALQVRMAAMLRDCVDRGWIDSIQWQALDHSLNDLVDAQGGVERIKNTPMPRQYDYFPKLFVQIYCLMLPIGMVTHLGWFTPLGSTLVGFMFLALDKIGRDLEDPFDNTIFDLPLTSITRTIEINLRQMLGEAELPAPVQPVDSVLW